MKKKKMSKNLSVNFERVDQWLKEYFLDPNTTYCDFTQFRIDLYETDENWIVEAVLKSRKRSDITVKVENHRMMIAVQKAKEKQIRTIDFPFPIINHLVSASFQNGILEVFISKIEKGSGKNRYITLT